MSPNDVDQLCHSVSQNNSSVSLNQTLSPTVLPIDTVGQVICSTRAWGAQSCTPWEFLSKIRPLNPCEHLPGFPSFPNASLRTPRMHLDKERIPGLPICPNVLLQCVWVSREKHSFPAYPDPPLGFPGIHWRVISLLSFSAFKKKSQQGPGEQQQEIGHKAFQQVAQG